MSVKVFSKDDLYKELERIGFFQTDEKTSVFTIWKNNDGDVISVNHSKEIYPFYYLSDLLECIGIEYNFSGTVVDIKRYRVKP